MSQNTLRMDEDRTSESWKILQRKADACMKCRLKGIFEISSVNSVGD